MLKKIWAALAVAGMLGCLTISSAMAQSDQKMSGMEMSHQEMMNKMGQMSADDKAAMFDRMSEKDRMSAMKKMGGHDMGKMSMQEKADMFDKMPMQKKMSMMKGMDNMSHDKMSHDKMDKQ